VWKSVCLGLILVVIASALGAFYGWLVSLWIGLIGAAVAGAVLGIATFVGLCLLRMLSLCREAELLRRSA
jgi:hypothetical protein